MTDDWKREPLKHSSCGCKKVQLVEGNTLGTLRTYCACWNKENNND